jgi:hypothetical protein
LPTAGKFVPDRIPSSVSAVRLPSLTPCVGQAAATVARQSDHARCACITPAI